ncbi:hypothetical protein Bbelb_053990 [Branchiostoma belcheri]|nr:hypothetical protein Bbelb_053990 [Branchiostoma belcheri]
MSEEEQQSQDGDKSTISMENPMYASHEGATRMRQPQSYWRSLANAVGKILNNSMYASSSADLPQDQSQTDHQARAEDDENTPDVTYANIPDDQPMDQPQTDHQSRAKDDENTPDVTNANIQVDPSMGQPQTDYQARAKGVKNTPDAKHAGMPDRAYPGFYSFLRARRSCLAAGIAVLVSLGLAPLTFSNKEEISQLSTTIKRAQDHIHQLANVVDALKRDQDNMLQLSTTVDAFKRDLDNERTRTAALEKRLHKIGKAASCPEGYTLWRGIYYKAFNSRKNFNDAAAACREDGGTLAMPRDAETNAFLVSLYKSVQDGRSFWIGLHDQREEGRFEWVDGSALGSYNSWGTEEPNNNLDGEDCVSYSEFHSENIWNDGDCNLLINFICQTAPVQRLSGHPKSS